MSFAFGAFSLVVVLCIGLLISLYRQQSKCHNCGSRSLALIRGHNDPGDTKLADLNQAMFHCGRCGAYFRFSVIYGHNKHYCRTAKEPE